MADAENGHTILVVEDDTDVRESIREVLEDAGYHVATAANGKEGLDRLERARPALILLDLMMPVMSGPELLAILQQRGSDVPVVVVSAYCDNADASTGVSGFISKPVRLQKLLDTVREYVPTH
jgi:two-component system, NtrC family, response regulator AtoC